MSRNTSNEDVLQGKKVAELREIAKTFKLPGYEGLGKVELRKALVDFLSSQENAPKQGNAPKEKSAAGEAAKSAVNEPAAGEEKKAGGEAPEKPKRRPGRPRKNPLPEDAAAKEATAKTGTASSEAPKTAEAAVNTMADDSASDTADAAASEKPKRRPGRPRKNPLPETAPVAEKTAAGEVTIKTETETKTPATGTSSAATESSAEEAPVKRRPGRPKGSKNKPSVPPRELRQESNVPESMRTAGRSFLKNARFISKDESENLKGGEGTTLSESYRVVEKKAAAEEEARIASEKAKAEEAAKAAIAERHVERRQPPEGHRDDRPEVEGILELTENGYGFLRFNNFLTSDKDVYVSPQQIKRFNLKTGDKVRGISRLPNDGERFGALLYVLTVNDDEPGIAMRRKDFSELTPIFPKERFTLELGSRDPAMRLIDLIAPIGKGQRGLIVAAPKAGKTVLLKNIANTIERVYPDVEMIVLLIDERPEEVTDMQRSLSSGEVIYSTFDEQPQHHTKVAEMVLARAQRLAEHKKDVVILLDSITRLARAYNLVVPASGRTLSGGIDPGALHPPKKFFGAARCLEEGGSITILATALVETGSRMDDVIFEEFKGTGNMELHLDRKLSEKRIFPAIDLNKSGTRREDLLMSQEEMEAIWHMRRALANGSTQDITETILDNLVHTRSNADFIRVIQRVRFDEPTRYGRRDRDY